MDLAGHTANGRIKLFASKPAPIQVAYLGYPNTTGLETIDYRITDAIADLLRNEGFERAVVDLGEFRTIGRHPDGHPWRIGIRNGTAEGGIARTVELEDMALAVSGGYGTTFESTGRFHHIFDPHTGACANGLVDVAVIGPRATAANGLSTAICVAGEGQAPTLLAAYPGTRAILTRLDGTSVTFTAKRSAPG